MTEHERFSVEAARDAAERGELAAWVKQFLASPGSDNAPLAEGLTDRHACWAGPVRLSLHRLERLAGPPGDPVLCPVDDDYWDDRVDDMAARIKGEGWVPTPVIVSYEDGELVLEDGNHRAESLRRAGHDETWAVIGFESDADRAASESVMPA